MGTIKCPKKDCGSFNTYFSEDLDKMRCRDCGHKWKPYKHRGKKMKVVGDGFLFTRKRIMPGSKTMSVGDGILADKKRVKIRKRGKSIFDF